VRRGRWTALLLGLAALATALATLGCAGASRDRSAPATRGAPAATPLLWHARAPGGGDLYLLGSVHVRAIDAQALGPEIQQAYADSSQLVVEVTRRLRLRTEGAPTIAMLPPQLTLDALIRRNARLVAAWDRGLPADQIQRYKPWFVNGWS
jgi:uncharacterized protein YbaP (TraB family)